MILFGTPIFSYVVMTTLLAIAHTATGAEGNLVPNPDFSQSDPDHPDRPAGWDQPDGLGVQWLSAPDSNEHGKAIFMDTRISEQNMVAQWQKLKLDWDIPHPAKNPIAETYGLSLYSKAFPIVRGQAYRVSYDFLGSAGGVKVWVRGYAQVPDSEPKTMRRIYEAVANGDQHRKGNDQHWHTTSHCFHPTKNTPAVTEMKVMLFAFYPAGIYWFDHIKVEPISDTDYETYRKTTGK